MDTNTVVDATRRWISTVVIGLNLCPFAKRVFQEELIRYVVSEATAEEELTAQLGAELQMLERTPVTEIETTLLIHPQVFGDFLEFNEFLSLADQLISAMGLEGVIQIASFHPHYQFEGTAPDDAENFSNRSPYPMLHLLREDSISRARSEENDLHATPRRNIKLLQSMGREKMLEIIRSIVE